MSLKLVAAISNDSIFIWFCYINTFFVAKPGANLEKIIWAAVATQIIFLLWNWVFLGFYKPPIQGI